jgi:hypothetical protein
MRHVETRLLSLAALLAIVTSCGTKEEETTQPAASPAPEEAHAPDGSPGFFVHSGMTLRLERRGDEPSGVAMVLPEAYGEVVVKVLGYTAARVAQRFPDAVAVLSSMVAEGRPVAPFAQQLAASEILLASFEANDRDYYELKKQLPREPSSYRDYKDEGVFLGSIKFDDGSRLRVLHFWRTVEDRGGTPRIILLWLALPELNVNTDGEARSYLEAIGVLRSARQAGADPRAP